MAKSSGKESNRINIEISHIKKMSNTLLKGFISNSL